MTVHGRSTLYEAQHSGKKILAFFFKKKKLTHSWNRGINIEARFWRKKSNTYTVEGRILVAQYIEKINNLAHRTKGQITIKKSHRDNFTL